MTTFQTCVRILAAAATILNEVFRSFLGLNRQMSGGSLVRFRPLPPTLLKMYFSLTILRLGAIWSEILTAPLTFKVPTSSISTVANLRFEFLWSTVCVRLFQTKHGILLSKVATLSLEAVYASNLFSCTYSCSNHVEQFAHTVKTGSRYVFLPNLFFF